MTEQTLLLVSRDNRHYRTLLQDSALPRLKLLCPDDETQALALAPEAELLLGEPAAIARVLPHAHKLRWAQSTYAGIDALLKPGLRQDYQLTNIRGIFGPLMSEYVFAHLLSLTRHLPLYREQQKQHQWQPLSYRPLSERRLLILGTGSIGQHLAQTAHQFGMTVWGINRHGREVALPDRRRVGATGVGGDPVGDHSALDDVSNHEVHGGAQRGQVRSGPDAQS